MAHGKWGSKCEKSEKKFPFFGIKPSWWREERKRKERRKKKERRKIKEMRKNKRNEERKEREEKQKRVGKSVCGQKMGNNGKGL